MLYFDTDCVLKCDVKEHGWEKVRELACDHDRIVCSVYGRLELHAALHRKLREGELTEGSGCSVPASWASVTRRPSGP